MTPALIQAVLLNKRAAVSSLTSTLIDRTLGTNIGDFTTNGGLAASFDGNIDQDTSVASANVGASPGYIGKTLNSGLSSQPISKAEVYGTNNHGFSSSAAASVTLRLYGKTGAAPANATDGTMLGTLTFTDPDNATMQTVTSSDTTTVYDHVWVYVATTLNMFVAEVKLYGMQ